VAFKEASRPGFADYQHRVVENAAAMADALMNRGIHLVSGGTDNHLMLADLSTWKVSGKEAEERLGRAGITLNKNTIPNDPRGPSVTSGIRIGTPFLTSRGMGVEEMKRIAHMICDVLEDEGRIDGVLSETRQLCRDFPLYK
jgi:glycine hydroxymethyltransferase